MVGAIGDDIGDGRLEGGAEVGDVLLREGRGALGGQAHGRLEAGEGEVGAGPVDEWTRQGEACRVAGLRRRFHRRPAGIGEAEELGGLVEGFAERIVDGGTEAAVAADVFYREELAVAAGDQQQQIGEGDAVGEAGGERMAFEVVDGDERLSGGKGDCFCRGETDQHAADETGAGGSGNRVDVGEGGARLSQRSAHHVVKHLDMGAGGNLGHDAAEGGMVVDLGKHDIGEDAAGSVVGAGDHRCGGFVAAGLDAKNDRSPTAHDFRYFCARFGGQDRPIEWTASKPPTPRMPALQSVETRTLKLGTRGSPLALAQAEMVRAALGALGRAVEVVSIRTTGDRITDRPLAEAGGKGLFTKEIDEALLDGRIDLAVHSAKDLPTALPEGIVIAACLKRADVRDAFLSPSAKHLRDLSEGATIGTASLRRAALALRLRPDLKIVPMRGNVETRLRKLAAGEADATMLALAGLMRLGLADRAAGILDAQEWLPAPGQGAIAITARAGDTAMLKVPGQIDHRATSLALATERAFLAVLDGSCRTPIGGLAEIDGDGLRFRGIIVKPDGSAAHEVERHGSIGEAEALGADAGAELARRGGADFFAG